MAFVGAAIVGGGLVAFKVEIPLVDSLPRQILLGVFGTVLLVVGFTSNSSEEDAGELAVPVTPVQPTLTTSTSELPSVVVEESTTTTSASTTVPEGSEVDWVLVIDEGGRLGVSIPSDWSVVVNEDSIWASPEVDEWVTATSGEGPARHNGYFVHRVFQPVTGTFEEVAEQFLEEMPVPSQCAFAFGDVERPGTGGYFTYRVYECTPGGSFVNEVEIGITPPWVTFESSRYLDDAAREDILARIWESWRTY